MNHEKREALRARATTAQVLISDRDLLDLLQDSAELERLQADTWQERMRRALAPDEWRAKHHG